MGTMSCAPNVGNGEPRMTNEEKIAEPETAIAEQKAKTWYDRIAETKITDLSTFILFGDWLREIKAVVKKFDEETAGPIQQAHRLHKALIEKRNRWAGQFNEAEELAKEKLKRFVDTQPDDIALPKLEGISFAETWSGEVTDPSLIPAEYLTPDIEKLKAVTKALKDATNIPGWKATKGKTISVRL